MKDDILRNGVPHNVTTSLVTHNAVLPQNIFIKEDASALRDSGMAGVVPSLVKQGSDSALDETHPSSNTSDARLPSLTKQARRQRHADHHQVSYPRQRAGLEKFSAFRQQAAHSHRCIPSKQPKPRRVKIDSRQQALLRKKVDQKQPAIDFPNNDAAFRRKIRFAAYRTS